MFSTILVVGRTFWSGTTIQFIKKPYYTSFLNISIKVCLDVMLFAPYIHNQHELLTEACTQLHLQAL